MQLLEGQTISEAIADNVAEAARSFGFFHWPLRFGEVMEQGGFDCVLGNPHWEVSQLNEVEYFNQRIPKIAKLAGAKRKRAISALELNDPSEWTHFCKAKREFEGSNSFYRSGAFPLCAHGKANTYQLFAEQFLKLLGANGRSGVIVPTGIATDNSTKAYFDAISSGGVGEPHDFENRWAFQE